MSALNITQTRSGSVCIVALAGRVDSTNATDVSSVLTQLISSGESSILVDMGAVLYLTSAAFRALLVAADEAGQRAAKLALCNLGGHARELFEMGGLLDVFTIYSSREDAFRQFGAPSLMLRPQ
jgi:anti-sigma B factor antagonist